MSTDWSGADGGAWMFAKSTEYNGPDDTNRIVGSLYTTPGYGPQAKVRPVITISKDKL